MQRERLEHEPRIRHRAKDLTPQADHLRRDLLERVKRDKRDRPAGSIERRRDFQRIRRRCVGQKRAPHAHQFFRVVTIALADRIGDGVGDPPLHRGQAARVRIAQVTRLHRRRLGGEDAEPSAGRVTGEVHQNVDGVAPNLFDQLRIRHRRDVAPVGNQPAKIVGHRIGMFGVAVTEHLDASRVVVLQHRTDEVGDGVLAEIAGDVPDAQPAIRIA